MRFGMMVAVGVIAATAGMAHGERENGKPWSVPNYSRYVPSQEAPIVLAQAGNVSVISTPDFILKECQETEHTPNNPRSAMRGLDPAFMLKNYLQRSGGPIQLADIKTTVLESTKHGKLTTEVDNTGMLAYRYDPTPGYLGDDRATFMAEYGGKRYKIIVTIKVLLGIDENSPVCPDATLIKVKKPASGSSDSGLEGVTVSFSEMSGGTLGQTTGSNITLDTNAARINGINGDRPRFPV